MFKILADIEKEYETIFQSLHFVIYRIKESLRFNDNKWLISEFQLLNFQECKIESTSNFADCFN